MLKTSLPRSITLRCGAVLNKRISVGVGGAPLGYVTEAIKRKGGKYRCVEVLARRLRGVNDVHGKPYTPTTWVLTDTEGVDGMSIRPLDQVCR